MRAVVMLFMMMSVVLRAGLQPWVHGVQARQPLTTCYSTGEPGITLIRCDVLSLSTREHTY